MSAYPALEERFHRHAVLGEVLRVLEWDTSAMMPTGGAEVRAEQLATLRLACHDLLTDPATGGLLAEAEDATELEPWQSANLREMRRCWNHAVALPTDLVEALSKACSACEMAWRQARPADDFEAVRPHLARVLQLVREAGQAKADRLECAVYDALLDEYEPGGRAEMIDRLFADLAAFLPDFIERVLAHQVDGPATTTPEGPFPVIAQRALAQRLMVVLGFDFGHGRLDESLHPFCGGIPEDVRITTRYDETDFTQGLMAVLHETGHALYERGLPASWRRQPVGLARSMSMHESQSLLVEMQVCRSREFLEYAAPLMREAFDRTGPVWDRDNLARLYTRVNRGLIRVEADEVTYPCHVLLRYRLERAMIAGDLDVADLPGAWREGMIELVGMAPPDDRLGCLQDIHWYDGAWGYFPTYTLGAMIAAQLFDAAQRADADISARIGRGEFGPLRCWLQENLHVKASLLETEDLIQTATGRPLDPAFFKAHLEARYLGQ